MKLLLSKPSGSGLLPVSPLPKKTAIFVAISLLSGFKVEAASEL